VPVRLENEFLKYAFISKLILQAEKISLKGSNKALASFLLTSGYCPQSRKEQPVKRIQKGLLKLSIRLVNVIFVGRENFRKIKRWPGSLLIAHKQHFLKQKC
jgi:hypothetical protein